MAVSRDCSIFGYPLLSQERVKLRTSNFVCVFTGSIWLSEQKSIKMSGKVAVSVVRDSRKFSRQRNIGRIARSSLRWHSFLVTKEAKVSAVTICGGTVPYINNSNCKELCTNIYVTLNQYNIAYFIMPPTTAARQCEKLAACIFVIILKQVTTGYTGN